MPRLRKYCMKKLLQRVNTIGEMELMKVNNDLIRKMRRGINDFLRPSGKDFISPDEQRKLEAGTLEKPLLQQLFEKNNQK